ncbi:hypothetical protein ADICEAN_00143 [Cesiribacter andamanensis AMV16]|uniref:Uncharacterized protein n=1 Tax=Cesiribacter andamanensis AMV16 TaxID=1279009 RepID=M7NBY4_9BACT|nr:hypothetical protein ADICEAN_00143 [Cesiribacter andamanensis AMV16]
MITSSVFWQPVLVFLDVSVYAWVIGAVPVLLSVTVGLDIFGFDKPVDGDQL